MALSDQDIISREARVKSKKTLGNEYNRCAATIRRWLYTLGYQPSKKDVPKEWVEKLYERIGLPESIVTKYDDRYFGLG